MTTMKRSHLPIDSMQTRHSGLTNAVADSYSEAARVCLDRHHNPPIDITLDSNAYNEVIVAEWDPPDDQTRAAWANEIDATEAGAYACALAAIEVADGLVAVHRAETRTGADYYVAPIGSKVADLEDCIRFEISGVDRGTLSVVKQRLAAKLKQAMAGDSNLPAMAGVVGFGARVILLASMDGPR
jgi:hypothetical protein